MQPLPSPPNRPRRRWRRRLLIASGAVLVVLLALIGFAPAIASGFAPGIVQSAVNKQIPGRIGVRAVHLGWGGPTTVGPVELFDDKGERVGEVTASLPAGVWEVLTEHWWSASSIDLGQADITGSMKIVRSPDGTTNLQRALVRAPANTPAPPPARAAKSAHPPAPSVSGILRVRSLDVQYTDLGAPAGSPAGTGLAIQKFGGDAKFSYALGPSKPGVTLRADFSGRVGSSTAVAPVSGAPAPASDNVRLVVDVGAKQDPSGALSNLDAKADLTGVPIDLVGGLMGLSSELAKALGERAEVHIVASGNADAGGLTLAVESAGAKVNVDAAYKDGVISASAPARIWVRSTEFLRALPAARQRLEALSPEFKIETWPSLDIAVASFNFPAPTGGVSFSGLDLRGASVQAKATLGAATGKVRAEAVSRPASAPGPAPAHAGLSSFKLDPLEFQLNAPDLAKPLTLSAHTKADLDGRSAGTLTLDAAAAGVLDGQGHLSLASMRQANAKLALEGASTALLQPILDGVGMGIEAGRDIGPTLGVRFVASSAGLPTGTGKDAAPIDATLSVTSANINADGAFRLEKSVLSTTGDGLRIRADSTTPLLARIVAAARSKDQGASSIALSGPGRVQVTVSGLSIPIDAMNHFDLAQTPGKVEVQVENLAAAMVGVAPSGSRAPGPVSIDRLNVRADLAPGKPPLLAINGGLTHESSPFTLTGMVAVPGAFSRASGGAPASPIDTLLRYSPRGRIDVKKVPRSLTRLAPSLDAALSVGDLTGGAAEVKRLLAAVVGREVDVSVNLDRLGEDKPGERVAIDVHASGADVHLETGVRAASLDVLGGMVTLDLKPEQVNPVLAAYSGPGETGAKPAPGGPSGSSGPMSLVSPVTLRLAVDPVSIPLTVNGSAITARLAGAPPAHIKMTAGGPIEVAGLPIGGGRQSAALADLDAGVTLPAAMFEAPAPGAAGKPGQPIQGTLAANLIPIITGPRPGSRPDAPTKAARIEAEGSFVPGTMERSLAARLIDVDTGAVDTILNKPGYISGALDQRAQVTLRAAQHAPTGAGPRPTAWLEAEITSARISGGVIKATMSDDGIRLTDPVRLTWTPTVAWVNENLLAPPTKPGAGTPAPKPGEKGGDAGAPPGSTRLASETAFTLDIKRLAIAVPRAESAPGMVGPQAAPAQGLFKPGVFALEASVTAPRAEVIGSDGTDLRFDEIRVEASTGQSGALTIDGTIGSVRSQSEPKVAAPPPTPAPPAGARSVLHAVVANFADERGFFAKDAAVLTGNADVQGVPTALLDRLAGQGGTLSAALGATVSLKASAQGLSTSGGNLTINADAPRATAAIQGTVQGKVFKQTGPINIRVVEVVPELVNKVAGFPPTVASVEKKRSDEAGTVTAEGLEVPTDGDKSRLNGTIRVSPGTAGFVLQQDILSTLVRTLDQKEKGTIGRHIDPFVVHIKNGVLTYDKFRLPLGEFDIETRGTIDLVKDRVDLVTYVPFFALTDEVAGLFKTGIAGKLGVIDRNTLVPMSTKGTLKNHKTQVDLELFVKETGGKIIDQPGKIIDDILNIGKKKPKK